MSEPGADGGSDTAGKPPRIGRVGGTVGFVLVLTSLFLPRTSVARLVLVATGLAVLVVSGILYDRKERRLRAEPDGPDC